MRKTPAEFLYSWGASRIYAAHGYPDEVETVIADLLANRARIPLDQLEKAAGGSLREYVSTAISDVNA
jgi:hypothetical protein